jgi:lipoyl(octanoyl) transferase
VSDSTLRVIRAGRLSFPEALAWQQTLEVRRISGEIPDTALCLEHPPVITLGHRGDAAHVLASRELLAAQGIEVHRTTRGGDVTYHGPGQLVLYPVTDLMGLRLTVAGFVNALEETMVRTARDFGVEATRVQGKPGVFVGHDKIGAVGIHLSRGVTTHGLAFNVDPNLSHFELILPCGLRENGVTSLRRELGSDDPHRLGAAQASLIRHLGEVLGLRLVEVSPGEAGLG